MSAEKSRLVERHTLDVGTWGEVELVERAGEPLLAVEIDPRFPGTEAARLLRDLADRFERTAAEKKNRLAAELRELFNKYGGQPPKDLAGFLRDVQGIE